VTKTTALYVVQCRQCGCTATGTRDKTLKGKPCTVYLLSKQDCCDTFEPEIVYYGCSNAEADQ
jgi:hypothetical protein